MMALASVRAHKALVVVACVATLLQVRPTSSAPQRLGTTFDSPSNSQDLNFSISTNDNVAEPDIFQQIARTTRLVGAMFNSFIVALRGQITSSNSGGSNGAGSGSGSSGAPLVAIDTDQGPVIDIPGLFGLNTGAANNGESSLVSISTQGGRIQVRAPFVSVDTSVDGGTRVRAPFVGVDTSKDGRTQVRAPFVGVDVRRDQSNFFGNTPQNHQPEIILS